MRDGTMQHEEHRNTPRQMQTLVRAQQKPSRQNASYLLRTKTEESDFFLGASSGSSDLFSGGFLRQGGCCFPSSARIIRLISTTASPCRDGRKDGAKRVQLGLLCSQSPMAHTAQRWPLSPATAVTCTNSAGCCVLWTIRAADLSWHNPDPLRDGSKWEVMNSV